MIICEKTDITAVEVNCEVLVFCFNKEFFGTRMIKIRYWYLVL